LGDGRYAARIPRPLGILVVAIRLPVASKAAKSLFGSAPCGDVNVCLIRSKPMQPSRLVIDPELSPLDLAIAPNGNIVISSEHPFGTPDAMTTVREYHAKSGQLIRVFSPNGPAEFRKPRGPDANLYCVAQDEVVAFDFVSGECLGVMVRLPGLHGAFRTMAETVEPNARMLANTLEALAARNVPLQRVIRASLG
jgi:hypothetical protein